MDTPQTISTKLKNTDRGRQNVEAKLIKSACELLARIGPKAVTIRDIAQHAGVNHGQIHHYFGSKKNLLAAAIRHLSDEHHDHHEQFVLDEHYIPPPLSLSEDRDYIMAIIRSVIDGDHELSTLELKDGTSVPRIILEKITKSLGKDTTTTQIKSAMLVTLCIEWGWAALGPYFLEVLNVKDEEYEQVREHIGQASRKFITELQLDHTDKS